MIRQNDPTIEPQPLPRRIAWFAPWRWKLVVLLLPSEGNCMIPSLMAAFIVVTWSAQGSGLEISRYSYPGTETVRVTITQELLDKSPSWKDKEDNPPLSARQAIRLANKMRDQLFKQTSEWRIRSVSIETAGKDKWYWLLTYEPPNLGEIGGRVPDLQLIVLMNGTVVQPVVEKR